MRLKDGEEQRFREIGRRIGSARLLQSLLAKVL
jgi:hypothetical protein